MLRAIVRVILAALALGLVVQSCSYMRLARETDRQFHAALTAEPFRIAVDVSKAGSYETTFDQTYSRSHGEEILLRADPPFESDDAAKADLAGLSFRIRILDAVGASVVTDEGARERRAAAAVDAREGDIVLVYFHPFPRGKYRLVFEISVPAPKMAGRRQELFARYLCCGLEQGLATIMQVLGVVCLVLAAISGGLAWWLRPRRPRPGSGANPTCSSGVSGP